MLERIRTIVMSEKDVTTVIDIFNKNTTDVTFRIGNCGWAEDTDKWFVIPNGRKKEIRKALNALNEIGTLIFIEDYLYFKKTETN